MKKNYNFQKICKAYGIRKNELTSILNQKIATRDTIITAAAAQEWLQAALSFDDFTEAALTWIDLTFSLKELQDFVLDEELINYTGEKNYRSVREAALGRFDFLFAEEIKRARDIKHLKKLYALLDVWPGDLTLEIPLLRKYFILCKTPGQILKVLTIILNDIPRNSGDLLVKELKTQVVQKLASLCNYEIA